MCVPLKVEENYNGGGITESLPVLLRCGSRNSLILSKIQRPFDTAPFSISPLSEMRNPMYHSMFRRMVVFGLGRRVRYELHELTRSGRLLAAMRLCGAWGEHSGAARGHCYSA